MQSYVRRCKIICCEEILNARMLFVVFEMHSNLSFKRLTLKDTVTTSLK